LVYSRPVFNDNGTILLHFREPEGKPAEVSLSSVIPNRPIKSIVDVNLVGIRLDKRLPQSICIRMKSSLLWSGLRIEKA